MKTIKKQTGISAIGFLFLVVFIILGFTFAIKTFPSYMENMTVESVLESIAKDYDNKKASEKDLRDVINKRFSINNIKSIKPENIEISQIDKTTVIAMNYEIRKPLLANLSIVMSFSEKQEVLY